MREIMKIKIRDITYPAIFVALMAICAWTAVPTVVPFTLQTFAVCAAAGLLGTWQSIAAVVVYIALGAVGVPVFSGFRGGIGVLLGNTGGYIIGFIFIALTVGLAVKMFGRKPLVLTLSMTIGVLVCYAFGTAWFMIIYANTNGSAMALGTVITKCVLPFIIPDAFKIALAVFITSKVAPALNGKRARD